MRIINNSSTSIHSLNADAGLDGYRKILYLFFNYANNIFFPNAVPRDLTVRQFSCDISEDELRLSSNQSSPGRKLSDLFWLKLPWDLVAKELGQINVLDTGCGAGTYGAILKERSAGRIAAYTGLDLRKHVNWSALMENHKGFEFFQFDGLDIANFIPMNTNFFMTQSAIEHFEKDLCFFRQLANFIKCKSHPVLQVHLFPAGVGLRLYPFHGVRQYTPRTVAKITRLFQDFSYSVLYSLGGDACNRLHWEFITWPSLRKRSDPRVHDTQEYAGRLHKAIKSDMSRPQKTPTFYALIIHSHSRTPIFRHHSFMA